MVRTSTVLGLCALAVLLAAGCSTSQNPTESSAIPNGKPDISTKSLATTIELPEDAEIQSAMLNLYVAAPSMQSVNAHRVTGPWEETSVTWNSFGGAFASDVEASFVSNVPGWREVDVTATVRNWVEGKNENHGLLLDQVVSAYPRNILFSRESALNPPYLEICYSSAGVVNCEQVGPARDVYISEFQPDNTEGTATALFTGYASDGKENQTLIWFDLPVAPPPPPPDTSHGCTQSRMYWLKKSGCAQWQREDEVSSLLPIWLGEPGGANSFEVVDNCQATRYLMVRMTAQRTFVCGKLLAQLMAAKLNIANGADQGEIAEIVAEVDAFLAEANWNRGARFTRDQLKQIFQWTLQLRLYNKGEIGPGACQEEEEEPQGPRRWRANL